MAKPLAARSRNKLLDGRGLAGLAGRECGPLEEVPVSRSDQRLKRGQLLGAISNQVVAILREHYGRGPMKAKTYALDDIIVVVMRGSGFTPLEQTMMDSGRPDRVVSMRHEFQHMVTSRFTSTIENLTGRKVLAFLSQAHVEPDITIEIFFIDRPLEEYGAVEVTDPET